ncbi:MAG: aldehyde dehydrogenase family protein [Actinobacteria bacterium]|nr:aldehyde dehydrogenase family protein [Actinomycetota bacterium]
MPSHPVQPRAARDVATTPMRSIDPRTGSVLGTFEDMGPATVARRVTRARELQRDWAALPLRERGRHLLRIRASLVAAGPDLTRISAEETGKPVATAYYELFAACAMLTWAARNVERALRPERRPSYPVVSKRAWVEYAPFGVVGLISPWNYPIGIPFQTLPYALGAGNTVVLKPSELATLTGLRLVEAVNAAGIELAQVVTGAGRTGEALVRAPVDALSFTGSPGTARHILRAAADSLTPVVLELGGKDPMIVAPDADPYQAARAATAAAFLNAGQTCMSTERAIVCAPLHERFVRHAADLARNVRVGPADDSQVGPLTRPAQLDVLRSRIEDAVSKGATIVAGGRERRGLGHGTYLEPTVLDHVTAAMDVYHEESFGPILSVVRARDLQEAVALANDSRMGLTASVFTTERATGLRLAHGIEAGGVNVNDAMLGAAMAAVPFGGTKSSGYGRLQGTEGFRAFSQSRAITVDRFRWTPAMISLMFHRRRHPSARMLQAGLWALFGRNGRRQPR